jgi:hypothetical protein
MSQFKQYLRESIQQALYEQPQISSGGGTLPPTPIPEPRFTDPAPIYYKNGLAYYDNSQGYYPGEGMPMFSWNSTTGEWVPIYNS